MASDSDGKTAARGDRKMRGFERRVDRSQGGAGADRYRLPVGGKLNGGHATHIDDEIGVLRKAFIRVSTGADGEAYAVTGRPADRLADGLRAGGDDAHLWRDLLSLAVRRIVVELVGSSAPRNQNQILFRIELRLQRRDRQAGRGFGVAYREQRTADDQVGRKDAGGLQEVTSLHVVFPTTRPLEPHHLLTTLQQRLEILRLVEIRFGGFGQKCTPVTALSPLPQNRIEISTNF